jgi:hypothetical protein
MSQLNFQAGLSLGQWSDSQRTRGWKSSARKAADGCSVAWIGARICVMALVTLAMSQASKAEELTVPESMERQIEQWVKQLDSPRFVERQAASNKLHEARQAALPALERAAGSPSREVSDRAVEVLKRHFRDMDDRVKGAAREVLERLAASDSTRVASVAREVLSPKRPVDNPLAAPPRVAPRVRIAVGQPQVAQAQIQIQAGNGRNGRRVSVRRGPDGKFTEVEEGGRIIRVNESNEGGIKVEIVETKDGKQETRKFEGKNLDELKKNHPEAHKAYEEAGKNMPQFNIQIAPGIQLPGMPGGAAPRIGVPNMPQLPGIRRALPARPLPNANPAAPMNPADAAKPAEPAKGSDAAGT